MTAERSRASGGRIGAWNAANTYGAWAVMLVVFVVAFFTFVADSRGIHSLSADDIVGVLAILALLVATPIAWLAYVAVAAMLTMIVLRMYDSDVAIGWAAAVLLNLHAALAPLRRRMRLARVGGIRGGVFRSLVSW